MPEFQYIWFAEIGFWLTLGVIQALAVAVLFAYVVNKLVGFAFGLFRGVDVSEYTFTVLPEHYKTMKLDYDSKTKLITATATYVHNGKTDTQKYSRVLDDKDALELYANNVQLTLMALIQKEIEEWNKLHSSSN